MITHTDPVRIVGLDLSLCSSGMSDGVRHQVFRTTNADRIERRLFDIERAVIAFCGPVADQPQCSLAVIEGGSLRSPGQAAEELAALRMIVRKRLWRRGIPFAVVPPSTLKLFTTGRGNASKDDMVAAVDGAHGTDFASVQKSHGRYDLADSAALWAMGASRAGLLDPCATARKALSSVSWPDLVSD